MARKKISAKEIQRRRRARENKRNRSKGDDACAICDNGGFVTCCDGGCQRSFHLDDSEDSSCRSALGITEDQAKMIINMEEAFVCKNCKYKQHQCFVCGKLGFSDISSAPEVFQCEHEDCGRFYHPKCVAERIYADSEEATLFEHEVVAGLGFLCPMHECRHCKGGEKKGDENLQFAVCRRCPTAYHRQCLPRNILFETRVGRNGSMQRAWDGLLPDRILIYCMKHDIVRELGTPKRDHIVFPDDKKTGVEKMPEDSPMEQDIPEEDDQSPPPAASNKNQGFCSGHMDSFAPKALLMRPQPGSCGWIDD